MRISAISKWICLMESIFWPWNAARRWRNANSWLQEPWNAARRWQNAISWLQEPWNQEYHVPDTPQHHSRRFVSPRSLFHITRDHRAGLVSSNRKRFAYYQHTFLLFWNSLYVYMRGILGCLLGFWPLGQNPAGQLKVIWFYFYLKFSSMMCILSWNVSTCIMFISNIQSGSCILYQ